MKNLEQLKSKYGDVSIICVRYQLFFSYCLICQFHLVSICSFPLFFLVIACHSWLPLILISLIWTLQTQHQTLAYFSSLQIATLCFFEIWLHYYFFQRFSPQISIVWPLFFSLLTCFWMKLCFLPTQIPQILIQISNLLTLVCLYFFFKIVYYCHHLVKYGLRGQFIAQFQSPLIFLIIISVLIQVWTHEVFSSQIIQSTWTLIFVYLLTQIETCWYFCCWFSFYLISFSFAFYWQTFLMTLLIWIFLSQKRLCFSFFFSQILISFLMIFFWTSFEIQCGFQDSCPSTVDLSQYGVG